MASAISYDLKTWEYQGTAIRPNQDLPWANARILAGSVYKEKGIYYLFFSAASSENILHEIMSLATSQDSINWEWKKEPFLELDTTYYSHRPSFHNKMEITHYPWRDPYIVKELNTSRYYMFFTANAANPNSQYQGCIGCAVADTIDGSYQVLPPAAYPIMEDTGEGIYLEMERPQVIYKDGKYHLFFSVSSRLVNPKWFEKLDIEERKDVETHSSLHWYTSYEITGPFEAVGKIPIVKGSSQTKLYGTNLMQTFDGQWFAYGAYYWSRTLEVAPQFSVVWDGERLEILINNE
jgi:beta-fructofuranosidase